MNRPGMRQVLRDAERRPSTRTVVAAVVALGLTILVVGVQVWRSPGGDSPSGEVGVSTKVVSIADGSNWFEVVSDEGGHIVSIRSPGVTVRVDRERVIVDGEFVDWHTGEMVGIPIGLWPSAFSAGMTVEFQRDMRECTRPSVDEMDLIRIFSPEQRIDPSLGAEVCGYGIFYQDSDLPTRFRAESKPAGVDRTLPAFVEYDSLSTADQAKIQAALSAMSSKVQQ
jgi:hypothetical protein